MTTVATKAGTLTAGKRYDLTIQRSDGEPRVLKNAKVVVIEPRAVEHCATCSCLYPAEPRYEAHVRGEVIGIVPDQIIDAEAR